MMKACMSSVAAAPEWDGQDGSAGCQHVNSANPQRGRTHGRRKCPNCGDYDDRWCARGATRVIMMLSEPQLLLVLALVNLICYPHLWAPIALLKLYREDQSNGWGVDAPWLCLDSRVRASGSWHIAANSVVT